MMKPVYAYDPATGEYQGSFYGVDPTERGFVVTEQEGWWGAVWDGRGYVEPPPINAERAEMRATRMQLALALGEARWQAVLAFGDDAATPWAVRVVIANTVDVPRLSETVDLLAWVLGMSATEVDDVFRAAMATVA